VQFGGTVFDLRATSSNFGDCHAQCCDFLGQLIEKQAVSTNENWSCDKVVRRARLGGMLNSSSSRSCVTGDDGFLDISGAIRSAQS
jgi:hypothetical protein